MITFEATACCEGCAELIAGEEPFAYAIDARIAVLNAAAERGWTFTSGDDRELFCPKCTLKRSKKQQSPDAA